MSDFHDVVFPGTLSYALTGGITFNTDLTENWAGDQKVNIVWTNAKHKWSINTDMMSLEEFQTLKSFFAAQYGRAYRFKFKDEFDYKLKMSGDEIVTIIPQFNQGTPGSYNYATFSGTSQLYKPYTDGTNTYIRNITRLFSGDEGLKIYHYVTSAWVEIPSSVFTWTVDNSTGIITWAASSGNNPITTGSIIGAKCQFYVPVRFDSDEQNASYSNYDSIDWTGVAITERGV